VRLIGRAALSAIAAFVGAQAAAWLTLIVVTLVADPPRRADVIPAFDLWLAGIVGGVAGAVVSARYVWLRTGSIRSRAHSSIE